VQGALSGLPPRFEYKISLGQNFLFDEALLGRLVEAAGVGQGDRVLEIGAGRGDLTLALAKCVGEVTTVEIDERLIPILRARLIDFPRLRLVHGDIMKLNIADLMGEEPFHVVANLPYYLTTPILTLLFKADLPILSINVMVQAEAAERLLAQPGSPAYGPLTVLAAYRGSPRQAVKVPAAMFTPPPKVDSVFITMPYHRGEEEKPQDEAVFFRLVYAVFSMRRKTLVNNLMPVFILSREKASALVRAAGLPETIRGERLSLADFVALSDILSETKHQ
jgi:16S rRNA (adenine1518-N6/adenine1519-N6)-dimethyltransferase